MTPPDRNPTPQLPLPFDEPEQKLVICDQPSGVFRPCDCGYDIYRLAPGKGPHDTQLVCASCGRGGRWLGRQYSQKGSH